MNDFIKSDLVRYGSKPNALGFLERYLRNGSFRWQVAFRLVNSRGLERLLGGVLWAFRNRRDFKISRLTKIGYGLYIGHNGPVVINPTAVIGDNVNLSQFVTIGSNEGKAATIGDCVYIGPGVCIVEDVVIGSNVTIGAGSVVTKDIPANSTAAGNYAKVLNYEGPGRYICNRWERRPAS